MGKTGPLWVPGPQANICVRTWTCPARLKHTIENHGNVYRNISLAAGAFLVNVYWSVILDCRAACHEVRNHSAAHKSFTSQNSYFHHQFTMNTQWPPLTANHTCQPTPQELDPHEPLHSAGGALGPMPKVNCLFWESHSNWVNKWLRSKSFPAAWGGSW